MPLTDPGSGKFVAEKEWSCPNHDRPEWHECDCEFCTWQQPECCRNAKWVEKHDADGNVVMREVGMFEDMMLRLTLDSLDRETQNLEVLRRLAANPASTKITWLEDEELPRITSGPTP